MKRYKDLKEDIEAKRQQLQQKQKDDVARLQNKMLSKQDELKNKQEQEDQEDEIVDKVLKKLGYKK